MLLNILYVISIIVFITVIPIIIIQRKKAGVTGFKSALTPICFLLIALINIVGYWFNFLGLFTLLLSMAMLILGAYFMKYMSVSKRSYDG